MELEELLKDEKISKLLNNYMKGIYSKYHIRMILCFEDYEQEVYLYLMKHLKNFDNEKSKIKTYLYTLVLTCTFKLLEKYNGQSVKFNKLEFENAFLSLDKTYNNSDDDKSSLYDCIECNYNYEDISINNLIINEILTANILSDIEIKVIKLMLKDLKQSEISKELNISQSRVAQHFKKAKEKILIKYV